MEKSVADHSLVEIENLIEAFSPEFSSIEVGGIKSFIEKLQSVVTSNNTLILKPIKDICKHPITT